MARLVMALMLVSLAAAGCAGSHSDLSGRVSFVVTLGSSAGMIPAGSASASGPERRTHW